jgi:hypothetical protein
LSPKSSDSALLDRRSSPTSRMECNAQDLMKAIATRKLTRAVPAF